MIKNKDSVLQQPMLIGLFLLSLIFFTVSITTLQFFFFHAPVVRACIPIAALCSMVFCYFLSGKKPKETLISIGAGLAVTILVVLLSCCVFDWSWDGNAYHKIISGFMRYGWNPIYETFYSFADNNFPFLSDFHSGYLDANPKATEIWGACIYALTGNVESAKSFNLLGGVATALISYELIHNAVGFTKIQSAVCALFLSLHPIMLSQMFTQYNDAFLWNIVLLCIMGCLYLTFFEGGAYTFVSYILVFLTINIGVNTNFNGAIYSVVPFVCLFGYWAVAKSRNGYSETDKKTLLNRFYLFAASVLSAFLFNGSTSYVMNTIRYKNPFYSFFGEGSSNVVASLLPEKYKEMSNFSQFFTSLFSKTGIAEGKFPLTFAAEEIHYAKGYDTAVGGWGILFSGILLISLVILIIAYVDYRKTKPEICRVSEIFLATGILVVLLVPGMAFARYSVALLCLPVCAMMYLFKKSNCMPECSQRKTFCAGILVAFLLINISPNLVKTDELFKESKVARYELERLQVLAEKHDVSVSCYDEKSDYTFRGRVFTLYDIGLNPINYNKQVTTNPTGKIYEKYPIYYKVKTGAPATNSLCSFMEEAQKMDNAMIVIAAKDEASTALTDEMIATMRNAGLKFNLKDGYRNAYIAVIDNGKVVHEEMSAANLSHSLWFNKKPLEIVSIGYGKDACASIKIKGEDVALNRRGLNIVLLDKKSGMVLDSIAVDTFSDNKLTRK